MKPDYRRYRLTAFSGFGVGFVLLYVGLTARTYGTLYLAAGAVLWVGAAVAYAQLIRMSRNG